MHEVIAFVYKFFEWLQKKFSIHHATFIIEMPGSSGIKNIEWRQNFKKQDVPELTREDIIRELREINCLERKLGFN